MSNVFKQTGEHATNTRTSLPKVKQPLRGTSLGQESLFCVASTIHQIS